MKKARVDSSPLPLEQEPRVTRCVLTCSPIDDGYGEWTWEGLRKINAVDVLHLFAEPDIKRLLRPPKFLKHAWNILRLAVNNYQIPLWCLLEIGDLPANPQAFAGCFVLAAARSDHLLAKVLPLLGLPRQNGENRSKRCHLLDLLYLYGSPTFSSSPLLALRPHLASGVYPPCAWIALLDAAWQHA